MDFNKIPGNWGGINWQSIALSADAILNASLQGDEVYLQSIATKTGKTVEEVMDWANKARQLLAEKFGA